MVDGLMYLVKSAWEYYTKLKHFMLVLRDLQMLFLRRQGIVRLKLLKFTGNVNTSVSQDRTQVHPFTKFPTLFGEIGEFRDEMEIKIKQDAQLFVQTAPRVVSSPLLPKLKSEWERLQKLKIIEPVEPTT